MEPYRPIVDQVVKQLEQNGQTELTTEVKRCLASIATVDQTIAGSASPLFRHMQQLTYDLSELFLGADKTLKPPQLLSEIELAATINQC